MIKRTCDRCGMVIGNKCDLSALRNRTMNINIFEMGIGFIDVDLCELCQNDIYEFIFHKKRDSEDGDE